MAFVASVFSLKIRCSFSPQRSTSDIIRSVRKSYKKNIGMCQIVDCVGRKAGRVAPVVVLLRIQRPAEIIRKLKSGENTNPKELFRGTPKNSVSD